MKYWRILSMPTCEIDGKLLLVLQYFMIENRKVLTEFLMLYPLLLYSQNLNELCAFWVAVGKSKLLYCNNDRAKNHLIHIFCFNNIVVVAGECESNRIFMLSNCAAACRFCLLLNTDIRWWNCTELTRLAWLGLAWCCGTWPDNDVIVERLSCEEDEVCTCKQIGNERPPRRDENCLE